MSAQNLNQLRLVYLAQPYLKLEKRPVSVIVYSRTSVFTWLLLFKKYRFSTFLRQTSTTLRQWNRFYFQFYGNGNNVLLLLLIVYILKF